MRRRGAGLGVLVALAVAVAAAIAVGRDDAGADAPLTVYAAASLTEVLPRIDESPRYVFGGSNQLAAQIRQGAPADVFLSASPRYARELHGDGLVERPRPFATNTLVLVVPAANPARIASVRDLARRPGLRLVVAARGVPAGDYTKRALERLGLSGVLDRAVSRESDVKGVVAKVALGEADAGFVYETDARTAGAKVRAIVLPGRADARAAYEAAVVTGSPNAEAARAFVAALARDPARSALRAAAFGLP